jgi:hypothetical protein
MIAAAPTVGSSAARPGYGVTSEMTRAERTTATSPAQPIGASRSVGTRRRPASGMTAMSAPRPSCQARVGREKNAHGADASVRKSATPYDAPITAATTSAMLNRPPGSRVARIISAGQKT